MPYDYRDCQSLFGYAASVHMRSGGICELCGCGQDRLDFDLWRQMTVEHLIVKSQGGYRRQIPAELVARYPTLTPADVEDLTRRIDEANTISACGFCNSTTSRDRAPAPLPEILAAAPDDPAQLIEYVTLSLGTILAKKKEDVAWKITAVRAAYDERVAPKLNVPRTILTDTRGVDGA